MLARMYSTTPMADTPAHSSRPPVTVTRPSCRAMLMANAATMPRAPVMAFQPAIAAAREASGVWSLTTEAMPTSIEALPRPAAMAATHSTATVGASA